MEMMMYVLNMTHTLFETLQATYRHRLPSDVYTHELTHNIRGVPCTN